jgi:hypothetical protein
MAHQECGPGARSVKATALAAKRYRADGATAAPFTGGARTARLLDTFRARADVAAAMTPIPGWVAPTVALSLAVIAVCLVAMGGVALALGLGLRRRSRALAAQLADVNRDARALAARLRLEIESYADLSADARGRLQGAMSAVQTRLEDLDALADVLQEEVQEAALSAASLLRTVRRSGSVLGAARRALGRRRAARED